MTTRQPRVLFIDDVPDQVSGVAQACEAYANVRTVHPQDVTTQFLVDADLVLVDYKLEEWVERDKGQTIALMPMDGIGLSSVLRGHAAAQKNNSPTAFAILSGYLAGLSGPLPPLHREHAIARTINVEWVFEKTAATKDLAAQIISLASAVVSLPKNWPLDNHERVTKVLESLLSVAQEAEWTERVFDDITNCHPPVHELSEWSHGIAFLRWVLHRIMPYPCFLWDITYLAARLRVTPESLSSALQGKSDFSTMMETALYGGMLQNFLGPRWWRGAVESLLWKLTNGDPFSVAALYEKLKSLSAGVLQRTQEEQPIVCVDEDFRPEATFCNAEEAVRIQPDDWPLYADQAWVTLELAKSDPRISAIVIEQDRSRLEANE